MSFYTDLNDSLMRMNFSGQRRLRFYRKLATMLKNKIPLANALYTLYNQYSKDGTKPDVTEAAFIARWLKAVREGDDYVDALKGWVPDSELMIIQAGKNTDLARTMFDAIRLSEGMSRIRKCITEGLRQPAILFAAMIGAFYFFGTTILPSFAQIVPPDKWTGSASTLADVCTFVVEDGLLVVIGVSLLIGLLSWAMPNWTGRFRALVDRYPPFSLYRLWIGSGFLLSAAALTRSNVLPMTMLRDMRSMASPWLCERIDKALVELINGAKNIGEALQRTKMDFPDKDIVDDIMIYASLGNFEEALDIVAREWMENGIERIQTQMGMFKTASTFAMGFAVMWIMSAIFSLQDIISEMTKYAA